MRPEDEIQPNSDMQPPALKKTVSVNQASNAMFSGGVT